MKRTLRSSLICLGLVFSLSASGAAATTNLLIWNKAKDRVDADVRGWELLGLLERIALETGWQVYVEPDSGHQASVKFKDLPSGEALRLLLGDLNFALLPQTNSNSRLYVFRTVMRNATQLVHDGAKAARNTEPRSVPNQLIVRLKPGADIEAWARLLNAKVIGRIPELNAYLLEFEDPAAVEAARLQLGNGTDVVSVDYNYYVDRPPAAGEWSGASQSPQLRLTPPPDSGRIVIGVLDTAVQRLDGDLENFISKRFGPAGEFAPSDIPTHGTTIVLDIMNGLQAATGGQTSATFMVANIFGDHPTTTTFDIASWLTVLVNHGANWINASIGGPGSGSVLEDAIRQATQQGIAIFAPSGNEPTGAAVYPGSYPNVLTVTALKNPTEIASYANVNIATDVAAPGTSIVNYQGKSFLVQGTSVATAFTTGIAAGIAEKSGKKWADVQPIVRQKLPLPARSGP